MKVTFLQHSGFLVEASDAYFLFDYYRGNFPQISSNKKLYVFVSHSHYDHYNSDIFLLREKVKRAFYIISDDVNVNCGCELYKVKANEKLDIEGCAIETLMSTDVGVAFIVSYAGKTFYHSGDNNWWVFPLQEEQRNKQVGMFYRNEILKLNNKHFDFAFVPVDPTLLDNFYLGLDYFMRNTDTSFVFPMHFWGYFDVCKKLIQLPEARDYASRIAIIEHYGQEWEL